MADRSSSKVTIIEVARKAGVSPATAGRVLGSYGYASDAIQQKVREAAEALGYRPNRLARGLITGKTQTIGVVAGDMESPFYASVLRGISDVARKRGFGVIITNSDENEQLEQEAVQLLLEKQVDGLLVSSAALDGAGHLRTALSSSCPIVQFDRIVRGLDTDAVVLDNVAAARDCVTRLFEAGHRRIGIIAELWSTPSVDFEMVLADVPLSGANVHYLYPSWQRFLGYLEAHRTFAVQPDPALIRRVSAYSTASARKEAIDVLQLSDPPSALFAADGVMSTGTMEAISSLSLALPGELSLVCFDDLDWMSFLKPGIATIAQPAHQIGVAATEMLLDRIEGQSGPVKHVILPGRFLERQSIAPLKP
ncbi:MULTISPECIES: LacI family DNA-binding transcriptional regulator [unclassified Mesorhizobium]|uniref:LacI family DNA-binding transcriptional regulator n=1 Tax=unclassified Mesorhizobium TaxID=325217 RepID=UPI000BAF8052|nr:MULTISPECIES: LacI family DNA-binding transcriptional regulator [unclassified Mesorhizobium]TGT57235.1 LacI family transcriptional regulator [Mesorhizobium sp. M00.F.Ca.ET.170.01.1.1]AZO12012.1 LacI family transcriptional regulator [Mesorhizobium sp. M3A.F.Ca.ET.080.04.2.1]PBB86091.1 LacI family transcriptional regulator [Mesorhizobium sp. WSM3876]RWB66700.1 MAG: LacI family transcriptional regulator [Mesorhizobium sp.]RWB90651.1 MAG: LacI family transcriptional regulator [Mesorhizobium sp.